MPRKKTKRKKAVKKPNVVIINPLRRHVITLYALLIFTWVILASMFVESLGGFVVNFKATLFGFIIGIGATTLIFYNK